MIATVKGPKQASRVLVAQGFPPMPGDWGPNEARITSDSHDLLSHLLLVDNWVESELSSNSTYRVGESLSSGCIS